MSSLTSINKKSEDIMRVAFEQLQPKWIFNSSSPSTTENAMLELTNTAPKKFWPNLQRLVKFWVTLYRKQLWKSPETCMVGVSRSQVVSLGTKSVCDNKPKKLKLDLPLKKLQKVKNQLSTFFLNFLAVSMLEIILKIQLSLTEIMEPFSRRRRTSTPAP